MNKIKINIRVNHQRYVMIISKRRRGLLAKITIQKKRHIFSVYYRDTLFNDFGVIIVGSPPKLDSKK